MSIQIYKSLPSVVQNNISVGSLLNFKQSIRDQNFLEFLEKTKGETLSIRTRLGKSIFILVNKLHFFFTYIPGSLF